MVCAVISDIHSNKEALDAVLFHIDGLGVQTIFCLGDLVGYNADPDICVETVMFRSADVIRGNHDKAVAGFLNLDWFNSSARAAALWTRSTVRAATLETIRRLPEGPRAAVDGTVLLCHGTPYDEDAYLMDAGSIQESYRCLDSKHPKVRFCFLGHTHMPIVVARKKGSAKPQAMEWRESFDLEPDGVYLINPGSVGQPRDGTALASFGILDTGRMIYRNIRARYAVQETQRKILHAGLPSGLAHRLVEGR
jgi:predicted phosphodiesterase